MSTVEAYAFAEHQVTDATEANFQFCGVQARIRDDQSFVWDDTVYQGDEPMKLLNTFQRYIEELADDPDQWPLRTEILRVISERNCLL